MARLENAGGPIVSPSAWDTADVTRNNYHTFDLARALATDTMTGTGVKVEARDVSNSPAIISARLIGTVQLFQLQVGAVCQHTIKMDIHCTIVMKFVKVVRCVKRHQR